MNPSSRRPILVLALATASAVILACGRAEADPEAALRPPSMVGSWVGEEDTHGENLRRDSVMLVLGPDAKATVRRWNEQPAAAFDSTAHYDLWKVVGEGSAMGTTLCLHSYARPAPDCLRLQARSEKSLRLAFPQRLAAPGAVVSVMLHRRGDRTR